MNINIKNKKMLKVSTIVAVLSVGLLSTGYLMPICSFFDNEEVNATMKEEMEKKVGLHA